MILMRATTAPSQTRGTMAFLRQIAQLGHPVLRTPAAPVDLPASDAVRVTDRGHARDARGCQRRRDRRAAGLRAVGALHRRVAAEPALSRRPR